MFERRKRVVRRACMIALVVGLLALPVAALAAFPGTNPAESPRANTPNDPKFDACEGDDPNTSPPRCSSYFEEEYRAFGFSPDSANQVPNPTGLHYVTGTKYTDCSQLDADGRAANIAAEGVGGQPQPIQDLAACLQIAGIRADTAFKYSAGRPDVAVAVLDTGIRWQAPELRTKVRLNRGELPLPQVAGGAGGAACPGPNPQDAYDCNNDGAFNVIDYANDPRVANTAGDEEADTILDGSDLIATFGNGTFSGGGKAAGIDDDGNGYVDDIAGWDFFDDDNDPYDASSCCSANGHGTGRATEAVGQTDNGAGGIGLCPKCQLVPLRVWDTFVVPTDNYAMGVLYAARNNVKVVEGAVGGLTNTQFARNVFRYADQQGLALMLVSSDINSANHNYPTNYNEAIYVAGSLPDTAPNNTCSGPGGLPGVPGLPVPGSFKTGCDQFIGFLQQGSGCPSQPTCLTPTTQPVTTSFFRNSNLTQYGGKADIVLMAATGSENTGQSSGAAGLLMSYGLQTFPSGPDAGISGNEVRQLLTMTAEDVLPANTGLIGLADKANAGWDPHFGYGRVNLAAAMKRIQQNRIPPEAQLDAPDWFTPIDVDRVGAGGVMVEGRAGGGHTAVGSWELQYACGQDALDSDFAAAGHTLATGTSAADGPLGAIPKALLTNLADTCNGEVTNDPGRPAGSPADGPWPADPYPNPDPERHAFQIRLTVQAAGDTTNIGRYRKTLFAYHDDGNLPAWPRPVGAGSDASRYVTGSGGETSPRLYDLDGDNKLDVLMPTSSGEIFALHSDGTPVQSFNNGQPVQTDRYQLELNHPVPAGIGVSTPHEALRVPAIGDIDGDMEPEIIATAGEHVYAWNLDGTRTAGFPVGVDRSLSDPCKPGTPHPCFDTADRAITTQNHIKRGFIGSPALADLDGDGTLDITVGALDQHLYAWKGTGALLPGFPRKLSSPGAAGAEIVTSPAIAQLDGTGPPEVVLSTNEVIPGSPTFPSGISDFLQFFSTAVGSARGFNPVYAVHGDGSLVSGWPAKVGVAAGDLLPLVLPGHDAAVLNADSTPGDDEVSVSAATSVIPGGARLVDGNGSALREYDASPAQSPDQGPILNLADYSSVGDILGTGSPAVVKGGLTVNGVANLLAVNQNLPFSHVEQAWDPRTGAELPGFPRATDDFQLVSQAAISRVGGTGPGHQALVGTGLYQLHAYGAGGVEPAGWPKFTGGWTQTTPSVGDADGDGKLDVVVVTREGWSFLWSTGVDACTGNSNNEWWTYHHDERSTANYGTDGRPPGTPRALTATRSGTNVSLSFVAPGDDWLCGQAQRYRIIASATPITHPTDGRVVFDSTTAAASGATESKALTDAELAGAAYLAVLYRDEAGNWGHLASVAVPPAGGPGPGPGPGPANGPCANLQRGSAKANVLKGTPKGDRLLGLGGKDKLSGLGGDDCVNGGFGNDKVYGGADKDKVVGQRGRDILSGGAGIDTLYGNGGRDRLSGGPGRDRLLGGIDQDVLNAKGGGRDVVDCGVGRHDVAIADRSDKVRRCEKVRRK